MAKTTRPRARMDRYFKHLQRNSYRILSYNEKGSCKTKIKKWDLIKRLTKKIHSEDELPGIKVPEEARYLDSAVKYLPRQDVMLYGMIPALEQRVYATCKNCSRVFNPRDILSHRACTKFHTPHSGLLKKKVKSKNGSSKSLSSNGSSSSHSLNNTSPVLPSSSSLLKDPVQDFEFKPWLNSPKDYDPDVHCGVTEHNRIPCMRSITCSNHRLQLRKQVSGRSKDIHQLIAEKKAAKENDIKHTTPPCSYTSPNGEATDILSSSTTSVPIAGQLVNTSIDSSNTNSFVHLVPKFSTHQSRHSTTSVLSKKLSSGKDEKESAKVVTNGYIAQAKNLENTQDNPPVGPDPVLIVPASPVSVVSSVQLLEIGNNIMSLESPQSASNPPVRKQMVLPVSSNHTRAIRMYKSHPKPTVFPNFGARRLGGAILLSNPIITDQRNDLLSVINGDSKGLVQDVNGFILHADVSQTVEAQQFSEENSHSQHKFIISLIKEHGYSAVKYLPRQDVMLYGMIPALEQRVYTTCKNCSRVFNARDILSHRACTKFHTPHSGLRENDSSKSLSSNGSSSSHSLNNTSPVLPSSSSLLKDPVQDFEFKRPHTPPPKEVRKPSQGEIFLPTTKTSKPASVSTSTNALPETISSDKSESKASSSKISSHHNPSSSWSKQYSSTSFSSHSSDEVFRFGKVAMTVAASLSKSTMDTLPPSPSLHHDHHHGTSSSSSRHEQSSSDSSKRSSSSSSSTSSCSGTSSSKNLPKDYDPDVHCGVTEHNRIPCMRSITCSKYHRLQLRKPESGRSTDIYQLIAEKKAAEENDIKHTTPPCFYTSPNGEATDILSSSTTDVPIEGQLVNTSIDSSNTNPFLHLVPKFSTHQSRHSTTSVLSKKLSSGKDEKESAKVMTNGYIAQAKNLENTDPVLIVPAGPVSVVSSVQLLEIGNNIMSLESPQSVSNPPVRKQMVLPVSSNHTRAIRMYKSHPKPSVFPNFGARSLGGAILLSNPLITDQRNDLLSVVNGDSKGLVQDVNGFILHADVSQTVEAQQFSEENSPSQHKFIIS